jgi:hypothetical protein
MTITITARTTKKEMASYIRDLEAKVLRKQRSPLEKGKAFLAASSAATKRTAANAWRKVPKIKVTISR